MALSPRLLVEIVQLREPSDFGVRFPWIRNELDPALVPDLTDNSEPELHEPLANFMSPSLMNLPFQAGRTKK
jgi:hypothetical protein